MKLKIVFFSFFLFFIPFANSFAQTSEILEEETSEAGPMLFQAADGKVLQIAEDSSGSLVAVSDGDSVTVYNTADFSPVCELFDHKVSRMSFYMEDDNEFFAVMTRKGDFNVRKFHQNGDGWYCEEGEPYFSADCSDISGKKSLTAVSFSSNSDYVAAAFNDNTVQVHFRLRVTGSSISHTITTHKSLVYGLEFSKNGEYLATVSIDGNAYIWNSYTTALITELKGVYARARVPVCFSEDSIYIISLDSRNSFRISDFSGNTLYSILTGRPITAIKPLKDPDLIAIRNDKNEVMVYSISSRRPLSIASAQREDGIDAEFTAFEFDASSDLMYAGYSDGMVCLVEPAPYLDDTSMLVTDAALAGKGTGNFLHQKFSSLSVSGGTSYMTKPYLLSANLRGEYLYSKAISPFMVGAGLNLGVGFPRKDFPTDYKIHGQTVDAPKLLYATLYLPAGYAFSPWNNEIRILTEIKAGAKASSLAIITNEGYIIGEPVFSYFMSIGAGMQIKWFTFDLNCEYDTLGKVSPSLYAGYVFRFGEKNDIR